MAERAELSARRSPVLQKLAELYEESQAGRTGRTTRDFGVRYHELLTLAKCDRGDAYANGVQDLALADGKLLTLEKNKRSHDPERVKVPLAFEPALFARLNRVSPAAEREAWSALMREAAEWAVPAQHAETWQRFCRERAVLMIRGEGWHPFRRKHRLRARFQLQFVAQLLAWNRPALIRTASAQITGSSKLFERSRGTFEALLSATTAGAVRTFADLQITDNPREVRFHGPLQIVLDGRTVDYAVHRDPTSLGGQDLQRATSIACDAARCVTVENATTFQELSRLDPSTLFIHTSYPNRATLELLRRLPASLPRFHFGDTDPWGFDVLHELRRQLQPLTIAPLHMSYRAGELTLPLTARELNKLDDLLRDALMADVRPELEKMRAAGSKGAFEQEHLTLSGQFPFAAD